MKSESVAVVCALETSSSDSFSIQPSQDSGDSRSVPTILPYVLPNVVFAASSVAPISATTSGSSSDVDHNISRQCEGAFRDHIEQGMMSLKSWELRELCVKNGIPTYGTKSALILRLRQKLGIRFR